MGSTSGPSANGKFAVPGSKGSVIQELAAGLGGATGRLGSRPSATMKRPKQLYHVAMCASYGGSVPVGTLGL
jgi:hypothetical protein